MRLITGISVLFYLSCAIALLSSFLKQRPSLKLATLTDPAAKSLLLPGLAMALVAYLAAGSFHLEIAAGLPYFLGGLLGYWLLSILNLSSGVRGVLLLLAGFMLTNTFTEASTLPIPLVSSIAGLTLGRLLLPTTDWADYTLPATWLIGQYWIAVSSPENMLQPYQSLLAIVMAVSILLRGVQNLSLLPEKPAFIRPAFILATGSLGSWLAIQSWLLKPAFLGWIGLFAGGSLLSFLLIDPPAVEESSIQKSEGHGSSLLQGAMHLTLIGIAALVASRLFGTLGWVVLATGLLSNRKWSQAAGLAALFFLGRTLLQGFLYQYNPNLTGINITHPYASAALYVGFSAMLLLPALLNQVWGSISPSQTEPETTQPASPMTWVWLVLGNVAMGGLANYFLHAEATGSLLVSLSVTALGVSLLRPYTQTSAAGYPLLFSVLVTTGALLSQELISLGNEADKTEKLIVLGIAMVTAVVGLFICRKFSGRKPVAIS